MAIAQLSHPKALIALLWLWLQRSTCQAFITTTKLHRRTVGQHRMPHSLSGISNHAQHLSQPSRSICQMTETADTPDVDSIFTFEEQKLIENIYSNVSDDKDIKQVLEESLPSLPPNLVVKLRQGSDDPNEAIQVVAKNMNELLDAQMEEAKATLEELLEAGEIRKLDATIGKAARAGKLNVPFFNVLTINLKDASAAVASKTESDAPEDEEGAASRLQILQHIYTRCQEEVEKSIPPGLALLNRLLRQPQQSIRLNLYEHYLTPQKTKITSPDGKEIELQGQAAPMVSLEDFVSAIAKTVEQIRTVENAGGTDRESAAVMVESCRTVAKEARVVIGETFGVDSPELDKFQEGLQPVFRPSSAESPYIKGSA